MRRAQERAEEASVADQIQLKEVDLNNLAAADLKEDETDIVLCKLVIAFVSDKKAFCEAVKTLLNERGVCMIQTPVLHDSIEYVPEDKLGIAVPYIEFKAILDEVFTEVTEFNHSYYSDLGDLAAFIVR